MHLTDNDGGEGGEGEAEGDDELPLPPQEQGQEQRSFAETLPTFNSVIGGVSEIGGRVGALVERLAKQETFADDDPPWQTRVTLHDLAAGSDTHAYRRRLRQKIWLAYTLTNNPHLASRRKFRHPNRVIVSNLLPIKKKMLSSSLLLAGEKVHEVWRRRRVVLYGQQLVIYQIDEYAGPVIVRMALTETYVQLHASKPEQILCTHFASVSEDVRCTVKIRANDAEHAQKWMGLMIEFGATGTGTGTGTGPFVPVVLHQG